MPCGSIPIPRQVSAWYDWIEEKLRQAAGLVVLASPESRASEYVTYEWASAVGSGIAVIPVRVRGAELHSRLAALNGFDFTEAQPWDLLMQRITDITAAYLKDKLWMPAGASNEIQGAVQALKGFDPEAWQAALQRLASNDSASARQTLAGALRHPLFPPVRCLAAQHFGQLREERAIPALIDALRDDDDAVSRAAAEALAAIGPAAVDPLLELFAGGSPHGAAGSDPRPEPDRNSGNGAGAARRINDDRLVRAAYLRSDAGQDR